MGKRRANTSHALLQKCKTNKILLANISGLSGLATSSGRNEHYNEPSCQFFNNFSQTLDAKVEYPVSETHSLKNHIASIKKKKKHVKTF